MSLSPATWCLARAAVTRTRRLALCPVKLQSSSVPVVGCDSAMARTLQRLPTSDEAGSLVFAPPLQPLSSCHAGRHVSPGAGPRLQIGIRSPAAEDVVRSLH